MKVKKLGKEWGAAYAEATPVEVSHGGAKFETFVSESHDLKVALPPDAVITWVGNGFEVTIPST